MLLDPTKRHDYLIISAMRGPDSRNILLKEVTTAVVRYLVGMVPQRETFRSTDGWYSPDDDGAYAGVISNSAATAVRLWETASEAEREAAVKAADSHFIGHINHALDALGAHEHSHWVRRTFPWPGR